MLRIASIVAVCLFANAQNSFPQGKATATQEARVLTGDNKGAAANNKQCKLFSAAEAGRYLGVPVTSTENAALGFGCQWLADGGNGDMIVAVVPASYHEPPKAAKGYRPVPEIGMKGFVAPQLDGWVAGSIVGDQAIRVSVAGKSASASTAIELLKEAVKRQSASGSK